MSSTTLTKIKTTSILTFTLVQEQLESNFKLIIEALKDQAKDVEDIKNRQSSADKEIKNISENISLSKQWGQERKTSEERVAKELKGIKDEIAAIKGGLGNKSTEEKLLAIITKNKSQLEGRCKELDDKISRLQTALKESIADSNSRAKEEGERFKSLIKESSNELQQRLSQTATRFEKEHNSVVESMKSVDKRLQQHINNHELEGEKLEFQKFKTKIPSIQSKIEQQNRSVGVLSQNVSAINSELEKLANEKLEIDLLSERTTAVQRLARDIYDQMHQSISKNIKTQAESPKAYRKLDEAMNSPDKDAETSIRAQLLNQLKLQKKEFFGALKHSNVMSSTAYANKNSEILDRLHHLQNQMYAKADEQSMKKLIGYIQSKLKYLYELLTKRGDNEEDACIAKKHWFCLSCDKKLDSYKGKMTATTMATPLKARVIQTETVGGGMLFRNKSRSEFPNVLKK